MKRIVFFLSIVLFVLFPSTHTVAEDYHFYGPTLSGLATNGLVRAYESSGLDDATPAPFKLERYVVTIGTYGNYFMVLFSANTTAESHEVLIDGRTGSVARLQRDPETKLYPVPADTEEYLLPGVVAGGIVIAYREAVGEGYAPLKTGAYATDFGAGAGVVNVGFERTLEPSVVSVIPAPTPTPGIMRCLSGCASGPGYRITVRNGHIVIKRSVSL